MFVPANLRFTQQKLNDIMNLLHESTDVPYKLLIVVDYIYHHSDNDYDDGLSFLDRLHAKIGKFHPEWNIQEMKQEIEYSIHPEDKYLKTIANMLSNPADRAYYGF